VGETSYELKLERWTWRTDRIAGEHAAAFLLGLRRLGQLRLRRQFAWRQNGAVVLRRSPRSRQDGTVSLRGEPRHPTLLF
jgi:hypothetical protein